MDNKELTKEEILDEIVKVIIEMRGQDDTRNLELLLTNLIKELGEKHKK